MNALVLHAREELKKYINTKTIIKLDNEVITVFKYLFDAVDSVDEENNALKQRVDKLENQVKGLGEEVEKLKNLNP